MDIRPIRTDADYQWALNVYDAIKHAEPDTPEGARLEVLITLIDAYERAQYPTSTPDPIDYLQFEMERRGLRIADLVPFIGQPNRAYEILNRKRKLTLQMIRRLHRGLGIPLDVLLCQE